MFGIGAGSDFSNAEQIIAAIDQGGPGLPDRDYHFRADDKSKELRAAYEALVARSFLLSGESARAKADAATVMSNGDRARARRRTS